MQENVVFLREQNNILINCRSNIQISISCNIYRYMSFINYQKLIIVKITELLMNHYQFFIKLYGNQGTFK